ncbi:MAG: hypothetical protein ACOCZD_00330 [Haloferacaceae archaeon]
MRRIYESDALHRDDEETHAPTERKRETPLQSLRSVPSSTLSDLLVPVGVRHRFVSLEVSTPDPEYSVGEPIPFTVTMRNRLPVPVSLSTVSPLLWEWSVDGDVEASSVQLRDPPDDPGEFAFDRGERKEFRKRWDQMFRVSDTEWEPAEPGEYTIGAAINTADAGAKGLSAETTVRIVR